MQTKPLLIASILVAATFSLSAADQAQTNTSIEARLTAIEQQLSRIEALVRASVLPAPPTTTEGQIKATIIGQINRPGVYSIDTDSPLASLVALAQGFAQYANEKQLLVTAKDGTKTTVDFKADPVSYIVRAGDVVSVPKAYLTH